jgi:hypothetical protein
MWGMRQYGVVGLPLCRVSEAAVVLPSGGSDMTDHPYN